MLTIISKYLQNQILYTLYGQNVAETSAFIIIKTNCTSKKQNAQLNVLVAFDNKQK